MHATHRLRWALVVFSLSAVGCVSVPDQKGFTAVRHGSGGDEPIVQLRFAKIPGLETIAIHGWYIVYDPTTKAWQRWEVWQDPNASREAWGHVHRGLNPPTAGVGSGPSWVFAEWKGPQARKLTAILRDPDRYPWKEQYAYVPGPNSNTYVQWVLDRAGIDLKLPDAAIGKDYAANAPKGD